MTRRAPILPPIPPTVFHHLGTIPITLVPDLRDPEPPFEPISGYWNLYTRTISIRADMHPASAWLTLFHEQTHAEISEIGIGMTTDQEEAICCAISVARLAALLASL